jgi:hypothetical protein
LLPPHIRLRTHTPRHSPSSQLHFRTYSHPHTPSSYQHTVPQHLSHTHTRAVSPLARYPEPSLFHFSLTNARTFQESYRLVVHLRGNTTMPAAHHTRIVHLRWQVPSRSIRSRAGLEAEATAVGLLDSSPESGALPQPRVSCARRAAPQTCLHARTSVTRTRRTRARTRPRPHGDTRQHVGMHVNTHASTHARVLTVVHFVARVLTPCRWG